jgi:hypothetical protein
MNRTHSLNTWLHRPATQSKDSRGRARSHPRVALSGRSAMSAFYSPPLRITDVEWLCYADGIPSTASSLHPGSRDLAKIAELFLDHVSIDKFAATEVSEVDLIRFEVRIGIQETAFAVTLVFEVGGAWTISRILLRYATRLACFAIVA